MCFSQKTKINGSMNKFLLVMILHYYYELSQLNSKYLNKYFLKINYTYILHEKAFTINSYTQ